MSSTVPSESPRTPERTLDAALLVVFAGFMYFVVARTFVFGADPGHVYPILQEAKLPAVLLGAFGAVALTAWLHVSLKLAERRLALVVATWAVLSFLFQVAVRRLHPYWLDTIIRNDGCTSFYSVALNVAPRDLLSRFVELAPTFPLHATANMPGKTLIFWVVELFSKDPATVGLLIIAVSNLLTLFMVPVALEWTGSRSVAVLAFVLASLFPGKVGFLPFLNTVTPGLLLLSFWLWLLYLRRQQVWVLLLLGASLYLLLFTDPLPFVAGVVFVGALVQRVAAGQYALRQLWRVLVFVPLGFAAVHLAMIGVAHFDIFAAFRHLLKDAVGFNQRMGRAYETWVVLNFKDYLPNAGLLGSLLLIVSFAVLVGAIGRALWSPDRRVRLRAIFASPRENYLFFFTACLLIMDLLGVTRAETTRLWIFFGVLQALWCAQALVERYGPGTTRLVFASLVVQTAITVSMFGFLICP